MEDNHIYTEIHLELLVCIVHPIILLLIPILLLLAGHLMDFIYLEDILTPLLRDLLMLLIIVVDILMILMDITTILKF